MIPDIRFCEECFHSFRERIFQCPMPAPRFCLSRAATFRGKFEYRRVGGKLSDPLIRLSVNFDLPRCEWEDVVIHEMIHYYLALRGVRETSHGPSFRSLMKEINERHGRNIEISHRTMPADSSQGAPDGVPVASDTSYYSNPEMRRLSRHYVCVGLTHDGGLVLFRAAATRLFKVWNVMKEFPRVKEWHWVGSVNPYYQRIPKSLKAKVYIIADYRPWVDALHDSVPLVMERNSIIPASDSSAYHDWLNTHFPA